MFKNLENYIESNILDFSKISLERKVLLEKIAEFVEQKIKRGKTAELIYICTHNSRRSHFGQIWAATAAAFYGIKNVNTFSGGTEATAFNERSVAAIKRAGFEVIKTTESANPLYQIKFDENGKALEAFSKKFDDLANPQNGFCAIMTCSSADQACPIVFGAELRVTTKYDDPKTFDDTPEETKMYDERCKQIATECFYVFSKVKI
ncbi:protein-tyrosine-phosphatase [Lacihabitans sp. LS3-19]|uniref:protein-tyrosine-phosphatase n=1 Tax=Lacihabitans sp. LS3-19 TaxID=2487335 RepID=UPI0020CE9A9D|nr:protein-tyrosine-phosphatase [Lacihabitans sp. LS3-19]MCP9770974.1 protein-tyrosine-phosphatase [Lacihabitans sp. LS3-19]